MYLSKIELGWSFVKNPYDMHKGIWKLFSENVKDERSFLFRVENIHRGYTAQVLLQSECKPTLTHQDVELLAVREFSPLLNDNQILRFCLRANPIKSVKDESKGKIFKKGKEYTRAVRLPLIKEDEQKMWLERKLKTIAQLKEVFIQPEKPTYFRKSNYSGKIQPVLFNGILQISDRENFKTLLEKGVGPAKGFGCGMLSIARI